MHEKKEGRADRAIKRVMKALGRRTSRAGNLDARMEESRRRYRTFREMLSLNDLLLQTIADIEDKTSGYRCFALDPVIQKLRRAAMDVFVLIKDLNEIGNGRYPELYEALRKINAGIEAEIARHGEIALEPFVIRLADLDLSHASVAGNKMATLGEIRNRLGLDVPDGFVITTAALAKFMMQSDLWEKSAHLEGLLEMYGMRTLEEACRALQGAIVGSAIPMDVELMIRSAHDRLAGGRPCTVAIRSSALGEDGSASNAGQYVTELNIHREELIDAYRDVVASAYRTNAVVYRIERGLTSREALMAVGVLLMVDALYSGVMFSRDFIDREADQIVISVTQGVSAGLTAGREGDEEIVFRPAVSPPAASARLRPEELELMYGVARRLEDRFGKPQDIEWALDRDRKLFILQSRPMVFAARPPSALETLRPAGEPILAGGYPACPGIASGPVFTIRSEDELDRFPDDSVLVSRHSSPAFSRVMKRCAAIVTDVGSPTGHMAILSREFSVPTIVGLEGAARLLESGRVVTVDATGGRIFDGRVLSGQSPGRSEPLLAGSPAVRVVREIARFVTPLHLIDPSAPTFKPAHCESIHDIMRFVHEKVFDVMFHFGDEMLPDGRSSFKLDVRLPFEILLFDVGDGLAGRGGESDVVRPEDIRSVPLKEFLEGLLDPRIRWDKPRPVSASGFFSVLGESLSAPPAEAQRLGRVSYTIVSDRYMNFSTKAGYHFSTVDTYCGLSQNKNYIHFRFVGGAAAGERRTRRIKFLSIVLSSLEFKIQARGDLLVARLEKYERPDICSRLKELGRLTLCSRQLDMLMDSDASPEFFAQAFLSGDMEKFY